jgi:hypothetical protein
MPRGPIDGRITFAGGKGVTRLALGGRVAGSGMGTGRHTFLRADLVRIFMLVHFGERRTAARVHRESRGGGRELERRRLRAGRKESIEDENPFKPGPGPRYQRGLAGSFASGANAIICPCDLRIDSSRTWLTPFSEPLLHERIRVSSESAGYAGSSCRKNRCPAR